MENLSAKSRQSTPRARLCPVLSVPDGHGHSRACSRWVFEILRFHSGLQEPLCSSQMENQNHEHHFLYSPTQQHLGLADTFLQSGTCWLVLCFLVWGCPVPFLWKPIKYFWLFQYNKTPGAVQRTRGSNEPLKLSVGMTWTAAGSTGNRKHLQAKEWWGRQFKWFQPYLNEGLRKS